MTLNPEEFTNRNTSEEMEDDEDLCWEPLDAPTPAAASTGDASASAVSFFFTGRSNSSRQAHLEQPESSPSPEIPTATASSTSTTNPSSVLKQKLVDHPINLFWSHFFMHLLQQLWELDFRIRVGLTLVLTGIVLKIVVLFLSFSWYHPKTIVLTTIVTASFCFLDPLDLGKPCNHLLGRAWTSPDALVECLERLDPTKVRYACFSLMIVPTLLEARTVAYLALVQTEAQWPLYNLAIFLIIAGLVTYLVRIQPTTSPRCAWQKGLLVLYGSALLITAIRLDMSRLPLFAAPFCLATGTLLLTYRDNDMEWLSRTVRHALRLTLRDVLSTVSANVQQDEMLRIIMLRWIVDYWTGTAAARPETSAPVGPPTTSTDLVMVQRSHDGNQLVPQHELQWDELWSMLNLTTDQVQSEVPPPPYRRTSSSPNAGLPPHNDSVNNVKEMLASMDLDKHAKPAVLAYKRAVEAFPPTRQMAIFISIVRRCPAFLAWLWFYSAAAHFPWTLSLHLSPFVVLDFWLLQDWMASCQQTASQQPAIVTGDTTTNASAENSQANFLGNLDPMTILLSDDHFVVTRPPTLLLVWSNVASSVSALEMGLTAARCLQTTAVAAAFAQNILSLAEFGAEVSQHGWLYGWTLLLQEWFQSSDTTERSNNNPKYTSAAVNAILHGNIVARNLRVFAEEGDHNITLSHLWQAVTTFLGDVLLRQGHARTTDPRTASTVEITEVHDDDDVAPTAANPAVQNSFVVAEPTIDNEDELQGVFALTSVRISSQGSEHEKGVRQEQTEDLSPILDLIATCFERGLIDEDEKNEFVGSLDADADEDEVLRENSIQSLNLTLCSLIGNSNKSSTSNKVSASEDAESLLGRSMPDSFLGRVTPDSCLGSNTPDSFLGRKTPDSTSDRNADRTGTNGEGLADSFVSSLLSRSQSFDEINSIPSMETGERTRDLDQPHRTTAEVQGIDALVSPLPQMQGEGTSSQGGDDWLKWVGGGLAIVGAVVGSVAIANAVQGGGPPEQMGDHRRENASSVQIELLDDDEGHCTDDWVSVSRS